jgi:hypothetical protein
MSERPRQKDCRNEPSYPAHVTCVFAIAAPALTVHDKTWLCDIECPHGITLCGEWQERLK